MGARTRRRLIAPTTPKQSKSKGGIGWHCTRNVMLSSLALVLLLRALLSSAPSPSLDKSWNNRQNQSTATASHVNHERRGNSDRVEHHFPANNSGEVPTAFIIRPNRTYAAYRGGSRLETFHSFVPLPNDGGYQVVYKVNQKDDSLSSGRAQSVETRQLSPSFEPVNSTPLMLGEGWYSRAGRIHNESGLSDPRAFYWNDCPYVLTWRHAGHDHANFLFNLVTGQEYRLDNCVRGYRGKNWVPLVYHGELYVIHRLSPRLKWFKYDLQKGCPTPRNKIHNNTSIDEYRGGTSFVPLGPTSMIALGHRTIDGNTHTPYLLHVEMADGTIRSRKAKIRQMLSRERSWSGILDPTSLWWDDDGKLWMGTVRTSGSWKRCYFKDIDECVFNMTIYEVELKYEDPTGLTNYTLI